MDPIMTTLYGFDIDFRAPNNVFFNMDDIATSLSNLCRYNGHCREHYSVGQHSILASYLVPEDLALEALLHDAAEAYLGDISRPLKQLLPDYRHIEERFDLAIRRRFGLPATMHRSVKRADNIMIATEIRDLDLKIPLTYITETPSKFVKIRPEAAPAVRERFLSRWVELEARR